MHAVLKRMKVSAKKLIDACAVVIADSRMQSFYRANDIFCVSVQLHSSKVLRPR
jgi:hypothetical protein